LQSLSLKFQLQYPGTAYFDSFWFALPKTIRALILQPVSNRQARIPISGNTHKAGSNYVGLHSLSLVLDIITDELILSLTSNLPNLTELCLEDNPPEQPTLHEDLTNNGLQFLSFCHNLIHLYLTRDKEWAFQRVNDMGLLLLAEGCRKLESVRLGGFSKVTDAGYASFIHSCKNLKRFEVVHGLYLSDLTFHDLANSASSLAEVRLVSCNLLTSEAAVSLSFCRKLGVLDLSGCRSIANHGLVSISHLQNLTTLDLAGADITDAGLFALAGTTSSISSLCLRGCKRISDYGICQMFHANTKISLNISTLDLGYLPRVTDRTIKVISESCKRITRLCLRSCFFITNTSITRLGSVDRFENGACLIRMLDLTYCNGISADGLRLFDRPYFRGLHWLGIGSTRMVPRGNGRIVELLVERPGLRICKDNCEIGCNNGWQYHS
jgi:Leucine Rich repeat